MKRASLRLRMLCFLLILPLMLLSCGQNEGKELLGRWETRIEDQELGTLSMVYHFTEDGEIFIEQKQGDAIPFSIPFGSFQVSGDTVTIESDGKAETYTFSVEGSELTLSAKGQEGMVFHRI